MAVSTAPVLTLAAYLAYDDGTENRYELVAGELVVMPPESRINRRIAALLFEIFLQQGIPSYLLENGTEIVTSGSRATTRLPDFLVMDEALAAALEGATRSTIVPDMPPPRLVVEIVSPGQKNRDRDYRYKRSEYGARGIEEYWIVDPQDQTVTILKLVSGLYEERVYAGDRELESPEFGRLGLTAAELLDGRLERAEE